MVKQDLLPVDGFLHLRVYEKSIQVRKESEARTQENWDLEIGYSLFYIICVGLLESREMKIKWFLYWKPKLKKKLYEVYTCNIWMENYGFSFVRMWWCDMIDCHHGDETARIKSIPFRSF